jgi:hypothetical protein
LRDVADASTLGPAGEDPGRDRTPSSLRQCGGCCARIEGRSHRGGPPQWSDYGEIGMVGARTLLDEGQAIRAPVTQKPW